MYAALIKLRNRSDRRTNEHAVLVPGGKAGVWIAGLLGFLITALSMALAAIRPGGVKSKAMFELTLVVWTAVVIGVGLVLYWRGASSKGATSSVQASGA